MIRIRLICVGKLKEKFYLDAAAEYLKRLRPYCEIEVVEVPELPRERDASPADAALALAREAEAVEGKLLRPSWTGALCVEGREYSSSAFSELLEKAAVSGASRICFLIGGSDGLDERLKRSADARISMSPMTFPHHLARVMLLEQIYRAFMIRAGTKYHK